MGVVTLGIGCGGVAMTDALLAATQIRVADAIAATRPRKPAADSCCCC